jgi:hypothetical protein
MGTYVRVLTARADKVETMLEATHRTMAPKLGIAGAFAQQQKARDTLMRNAIGPSLANRFANTNLITSRAATLAAPKLGIAGAFAQQQKARDTLMRNAIGPSLANRFANTNLITSRAAVINLGEIVTPSSVERNLVAHGAYEVDPIEELGERTLSPFEAFYFFLEWLWSLPETKRFGVEDKIAAAVYAVEFACNTAVPTRLGTSLLVAMAVVGATMSLCTTVLTATDG